VFENRVLRKIFGPEREEVEGGWRRQHNELHTDIIQVIKLVIKLVGHVARMGGMRNAYFGWKI
jgi:hypothetical protein